MLKNIFVSAFVCLTIVWPRIDCFAQDESPAAEKTDSPAAVHIDPCKPGGPLVTLVSPSGAGEDENPDVNNFIHESERFVVQSNCPVDPHSVAQAVSFEVEGIKSSIGAQVVDGAAREKVLAQKKLAGHENLIVIKPRLRFPYSAKVALVWGKGVRSVSGFVRTEPQRYLYRVRPPFEIGVRCSHTYADGSCDPYLPIYAVFTDHVPTWAVGEYQFPEPITLRSASGQDWQGVASSFLEDQHDLTAVKFSPPFPAQQELTLAAPEALEDSSGRFLENRAALPLKVRTGKIPPMVRFNSVFGIVELHGGGALPVTLRNIDTEISVNSAATANLASKMGSLNAALASTDDPQQVLRWLIAVQNRYEHIEDNTTSLFDGNGGISTAVDTFTVKKPNGSEPFEVVGIPFTKPGFYALEIASPAMGADLKGAGKILYVPTTALVTNLAVHLKLGKESSLAWVTALDSGQPVGGAEVRIEDCNGAELFRGTTGSDGTAHIPELQSGWAEAHCGLEQKTVTATGVAAAPVRDGSLIVSARAGDDFTFALSSWDEGIEPWRFGVLQDYAADEARIGRTIFDRTLLRRGETVHMKHLLRIKTGTGFQFPENSSLPEAIELWHVGSGERFEVPLEWNANGTAQNEWNIPKDAKLGDYDVYFKRPDGSTDYHYLGAFSVLEYRVPLMHASIMPPKNETITPPSVPIDVAVRYLAGGGASKLPVKVRYQVQPATYNFGGAFEDYSFAQEIEPGAEQSTSSESEGDEESSAPAEKTGSQTAVIRTVAATLDAAGTARVVLDKVSQVTRPAKLFTELEFKDPNGEIQTVSSSIPLLPSPYLVGIKTDTWLQNKSHFKFYVGVVNSRGEPIKQAPVSVQLYQRDTYTHRKRVVGGSFIYENETEDTDRGGVCTGATNENGVLECTVLMQLSGSFILEASAADPEGRISKTASSIFVGDDDFWFAQGNTDRIDLLPEKKMYEPGETARFQVRVPFKESTALVTIEREGILDSFVTKLSRSNPVIEVPVKGNYGPNVFVSVMAVRGRLDAAKATAIFDPGKPAFRLGMAQIKVGWKAYTLHVDAHTERSVFKVREKVPVHFTVKTADGGVPPAGSEVAVAAVDEGLLELKANESWDLLQAMMGMRPLSVRTITAQMFVIGKRHFGLKALPFGGGGGKALTRELFDTLLYWNPAVPLNEKGEADVTIPLNDSITSFRIVGVATGGTSMFGTGSTTIRSNKDFILFSGLSPVIRNGDSFRAEITARNTTDTPAKVEVSLQSDPELDGLAMQTVQLGAGESHVLDWDLKAPAEGEAITYKATLVNGGMTEDALKVSQHVSPAVPVRIVHGTLSQLHGSQTVPFAVPDRADPKRGGQRVTLTSSLGENLEALRDYMRAYPYACLEQMVSKAVALGDPERWNNVVNVLPTLLDRDGFAKYFTLQDRGDEVLTSYVLSISNEAGLQLPDSAKEKMIGALKRFVAGKLRTESYPFLDEFYSALGYKLKMPAAELDLLTRKITALDALSRFNEADPALVAGLWVDPSVLPTEAAVEMLAITLRMKALPDRAHRLAQLEQSINARLDMHGTVVEFNYEKNEAFFWQMISADTTAVRFVGTVFSNDELYKKYAPDAGRIVRGMLERQYEGHWDLTDANAWGALALQREQERLSPVPVAGTTEATAGSEHFAVDWSSQPKGGAFLFPWSAVDAGNIKLTHTGAGVPWVMVHTLAAIDRTEPISEGYTVHRDVEPVEQKTKGEWHVGDVLRVNVKFTSEGTKTWVVVEDPIPAGATILGSGLNRDSSLLSGTRQAPMDWFYPAFEERTFEAYRAYYQVVPKGDYTVQYLVRLNTSGTFKMPATHIEAMYAPEVFGELPNEAVTVLP